MNQTSIADGGTWPTKALGEICSIRIGRTPSRRQKTYWGPGSPWLSIADMNQGRWIRDTSETITPLAVSECRCHLVPAGTVVLSFKLSIGKVGITQRPMYTNEAIAALQIDDAQHISADYLYWALRSLDLTAGLDRAAKGLTLNRSKVANIRIPTPSLSEQHRIVDVLVRADGLRAKRHTNLARIDSLFKAIFLELFGDPLANPKRFPTRKLSEFYLSDRTGTKCGPFGSALGKHELAAEGVPVWNIDNIGPDGRFSPPFRMWITEQKYTELQAYSVLAGDIIVSRAGTVGKMCVVGPEVESRGIISTNLIRIRLDRELLPYYFASLMNHFRERVGRLKAGADGALTHMNTRVLDNLTFPYPPLRLQEEFVRAAAEVNRFRDQMLSHQHRQSELFDSLQHKAFRGEL